MFFSTNSSTKNGYDPFSLPPPPPPPPPDPDHSFHLPISFFPFPSPFEVDDHEYYNEDDLFNFTTNSHNNVIPPPPPTTTTTTTPTALEKIPTNTTLATTTMATIMNSDEKKKIPRKRLSKKDRHSKITTARGLRDRRMRLSLPVARQFFGLQDMLGVDKGSKTVEWLLIQARPEILKLARDRNCSSLQIMSTTTTTAVLSSNNSNSEGDMVSGIDEAGVGAVDHEENLSSFKKDIKKKKIIRAKQPRKTMAKELRAMARERARTRTIEKIKNQIRDCSVSDFDINHHHHHQPNNNLTKIPSCSWSSPFETGEESGGTTHSYNNLNPAIEVQSSDQPVIDHCQIFQHFSSIEIMAKWSPSDSTLNYLHQTETLDHHLHQEQHEFESSDIFG